jgi:ATP-dependent RNA helicase RhlB
MAYPVSHTPLECVKPAHCLTPRRHAHVACRRYASDVAGSAPSLDTRALASSLGRVNDEATAQEPSTTAGAATGRAFDTFDLPEPVREGVRAAGFTHCTPIQEKTLPITLDGKDVAGQAQTGTGKTAAFLITLFTRLLEKPRAGKPAAPRALIIAPTRELVVQIANDARVLGQFTPFTIHAVFGGVDYKKQRDDVAAGVDVLIGTPGRLIDYHKQRVYDLRSTEILVIDEADRMFDMGFIKDLRYILRQLPSFERRQSLLFSATLSFDVMELAYVFMNEPVKVSVTPEQVTAERVEHLVFHCGLPEKMHVLVSLLRRETGARVLVFTNMRRSAERIERTLVANGFAAAAITGDVDQRRRLRILEEFKDGTLPILVATDVASRGLHIDGVTHVVNYDLPLDPEDYVHRVGRTARAGASGKAVSLACEDYVQGLEAIEAFIGFKLPHDFPDDAMLAEHVVHPPRLPRRDDRHGHGRGGDRHDRHERHGRPERRESRPHGERREPGAATAPKPSHGSHASHGTAPAHGAAPAAGDAPKKRRRRRRRKPGGGAAPATPSSES